MACTSVFRPKLVTVSRKRNLKADRLNVEMLGLSQSVAEAMQMAQDRTIVSVMPWTEKRDDGIYLCIPAEAGYSLTEEKFERRPD